MSTPLLELSGIGKRFPGVVALDGVSLSLGRGEVVALIGENGAGKSTLMKTLGGVHQPDDGRILVDGQPVTIRSVQDSERLGIGFVHQELNNLDNLDVAANLYLGREPLWGGPLKLVDRRRMERDSEQYLRRLGLNVSPRTPLAQLSLAQQQLVGDRQGAEPERADLDPGRADQFADPGRDRPPAAGRSTTCGPAA